MPETNSSFARWTPMVLAAAIVIASVYLYSRVQSVSGDVAALRETLQKETAALRNDNAAARDATAKQLESLRNELQNARAEVVAGVRQASGEAKRHAALVAKQLNEQEVKRQQQVASELTEVKESARSANARIADVSNDVTGVKSDVSSVKTEVASTRAELQKTVSELKRMTGDMGVMSGLIATSSKELAALKELGERNYSSFDLAKSKRPQRVGDVQVLLKKADPKRQRYSIDVIADDKKVEKKDKGVNEPVQFYVTSRARQPYEVVVNEVQPDRIVGYLATPKVTVARN
jgi:chromosome segregation ATPase